MIWNLSLTSCLLFLPELLCPVVKMVTSTWKGAVPIIEIYVRGIYLQAINFTFPDQLFFRHWLRKSSSNYVIILTLPVRGSVADCLRASLWSLAASSTSSNSTRLLNLILKFVTKLITWCRHIVPNWEEKPKILRRVKTGTTFEQNREKGALSTFCALYLAWASESLMRDSSWRGYAVTCPRPAPT